MYIRRILDDERTTDGWEGEGLLKGMDGWMDGWDRENEHGFGLVFSPHLFFSFFVFCAMAWHGMALALHVWMDGWMDVWA